MYGDFVAKQFAFVGAALLLAACAEQSTSPTVLREADAPSATSHDMAHQITTYVALQAQPTFTVRAPLAPYRIQQLPDFMIHSKATTEIVFQRLAFGAGAGPWHTHPGPSFVYVLEGKIKLQRFTKKDGCTETPVFEPGNAYFEVGNEVHRAVVVSEDSARLFVTRFNIPVGGMITIPAAPPGC